MQTPWPKAAFPSLSLSFSVLYTHTSPSVTVVAFPEPQQAIPARSPGQRHSAFMRRAVLCLLLTVLRECYGAL